MPKTMNEVMQELYAARYAKVRDAYMVFASAYVKRPGLGSMADVPLLSAFEND